MAKSQGVWGIDLGQCAVKALRCVPHEDDDKVTADAFDYIEYPQILSQPEADPAELIADALREFLSRNEVNRDKVAICVPGQQGLARFIKLPPVETKKIPDIVKYEARQQIPFDLDDVVWDYQQMAGGLVEEGFALETEVGLFAMKREQVARAMKPFDEAGIEVDIVQITPLALYNYVAFDEITDLPPADEYDPENPPESVLLLSLGTETTDLVITNGFRVWQRSVPVGGNHFTKALAKEMKQTFAKAEHIKRNAAQAENPKALFQAMRGVFADLVTEVQRSLNFFSNVDKKAKITRGVAVGSTAKLPGLVRFLSQNLKMPITRAESLRGLKGPGIVDAPAFKENVLSFGVCYGLCLQGLAEGKIGTNLIPQEIVTERLIRAKKPWAVASAAALLLGLTISFFGHWHAVTTVADSRWKDTEDGAKRKTGLWKQWGDGYTAEKKTFTAVDDIGDHLQYKLDERIKWLKLWQIVHAVLPSDPRDNVPEKVEEQDRVIITAFTTHKQDLTGWYGGVTSRPSEQRAGDGGGGDLGGYPTGGPQGGPGAPNPGGGAGAPPGSMPGSPGGVGPAGPAGPGGPGSGGSTTPVDNDAPTGIGWICTLRGYHFHNIRDNPSEQGAEYIYNTVIENLKVDYFDPTDHKFFVYDPKVGDFVEFGAAPQSPAAGSPPGAPAPPGAPPAPAPGLPGVPGDAAPPPGPGAAPAQPGAPPSAPAGPGNAGPTAAPAGGPAPPGGLGPGTPIGPAGGAGPGGISGDVSPGLEGNEKMPPSPAHWIPIKQFGISHPVLVHPGGIDWNYMVPNPDYNKDTDPEELKYIRQPKFDFLIQFVWIDPDAKKQPAGQSGTSAGNQNPGPGPSGMGPPGSGQF